MSYDIWQSQMEGGYEERSTDSASLIAHSPISETKEREWKRGERKLGHASFFLSSGAINFSFKNCTTIL